MVNKFFKIFHPVGAHPSYLIGDDPISVKSKNLMPNIIDVVKGITKEIKILVRTTILKMEHVLEIIFTLWI